MLLLVPQLLIRESFVRVLRAAGVNVVGESSNFQQFISGLSSARPDVAVVDLAGLDSTGPGILKEARQFHPEVQLLALLPGVDASSVDRFIEAGAAGYLDPGTRGCDALVDAIRAVGRGERVFPALFLETFVRNQVKTERGPAPSTGVLQALSLRERQVLGYVAEGQDNISIAHALGISERTVKAHVSHLYRKLNQGSRTQLALLARKLGVTPVLAASAEGPEPRREEPS